MLPLARYNTVNIEIDISQWFAACEAMVKMECTAANVALAHCPMWMSLQYPLNRASCGSHLSIWPCLASPLWCHPSRHNHHNNKAIRLRLQPLTLTVQETLFLCRGRCCVSKIKSEWWTQDISRMTKRLFASFYRECEEMVASLLVSVPLSTAKWQFNKMNDARQHLTGFKWAAADV